MTLIVVEPHPPPAKLPAKNPALLAKVVDHLQLALVHPAGHGDQHEPERIQESRHLVSSLSRASPWAVTHQREFKRIQFPDHTGKVLDSERTRYFAGTVGSANSTGNAQTYGTYGTYQGNTNTSQTAVYKTYQTFLIEGETHTYLVQQRLRWRWSNPANLTVNDSVKLAVDRRRLFVIDDDGKQHEMEIVKRVLRQPTQP